MKTPLSILVLSFALLYMTATIQAAPADAGKGTPRVQFETNFFDFGKITASGTLSGVFKFKNTGDGILRVDPPVPSCDCTESKVKPDTLAPGESGEITYTIKLDRPLSGRRHINVHSNDPHDADVQLTMQMDATPLYELSPTILRVIVPPGKEEAQANFTITRTDGKPLQIDRLAASPEWVSAAFDSSFKAQDPAARINVSVRRPADPPPLISASVQMWNNSQPEHPIQILLVTGEIQGELAAIPPRVYWVIPDFGKDKINYPAEALTRKIELKSVLGREVEIKNPSCNIKGLAVEIVPKEAGKKYDLVLKFDDLPQGFTNGKVTVETSLASLPKLEVPLTISVPGGK